LPFSLPPAPARLYLGEQQGSWPPWKAGRAGAVDSTQLRDYFRSRGVLEVVDRIRCDAR